MKYQIFSLHTDTGSYEQSIWTTLHGNFLESTLAVSVFPWHSLMGKGTYALPEVVTVFPFSTVHTNFIIILFAPFYALFPFTETLLVASSVALASGAIPLYFLAQKELKNKNISLIISISYLICPSLLAANMPDFNFLVFAVPFLLSAFYFFRTENWRFYWIFVGLTLTIREEMTFAILGLGIYIFLFSKHRKIGIITILVSILLFFILMRVIFPTFIPIDLFGGNYNYLTQGKGLDGIVSTLFTNPGILVDHFSNSNVFFYMIQIFSHTGFLTFLSPAGFLLSLPELTKNILAQNDSPFRLIWNHYQLVLVPGVFISTIFALKRILNKFGKNKKSILILCSFLMISALLSNSLYSGAPIIGLEFVVNEDGLSLEKRSVWWWEFANPYCCWIYDLSNPVFVYYLDQIDSLNTAISMIPDTVSVVTQDEFAYHLSQRSELYVFPIYYDKVDYVLVVDKTVGMFSSGMLPEEVHSKYVALLKNNEHYDIIFQENGLLLFKRNI